MKPVILNGITDVATRPDLLDRALVVSLPPIPDEERRPEAELWSEFEQAAPPYWHPSSTPSPGRSVRSRTYGSKVCLGWRTSRSGPRPPRSVGLGAWRVHGRLLRQPTRRLPTRPRRRSRRRRRLDLMADRDEWTGSATELWKALGDLVDEGVRQTKAWPGAPNALTGTLKRLAPTLRGVGIEYGEDRSGRSRKKMLTKNKPAKDRHDRHHRHDEEFSAEESQMRGDGPGDGPSGGDGPDRHSDDPAHRDRHTGKPHR